MPTGTSLGHTLVAAFIREKRILTETGRKAMLKEKDLIN
jgi:hypothetical protein